MKQYYIAKIKSRSQNLIEGLAIEVSLEMEKSGKFRY